MAQRQRCTPWSSRLLPSSGRPPGKEVWAGDIEVCAGPDAARFNFYYFQLQMPDNTRGSSPTSVGKTPPLSSGTLAASAWGFGGYLRPRPVTGPVSLLETPPTITDNTTYKWALS
jgi:hypothetical protein